jgi:hypothetical protein
MNRLTAWAKKYESAEAHYYLYIINYLLWRKTKSPIGEEQILFHIKRCKELTTYRTDFSYEWLALSPPWCPLQGHHGLGKMRPRGVESLFEDTSGLDRATGFLPASFARQGGHLKISPRLTAFFVPSEELRTYKDKQAEVNFFLGFSYEGFRAWDPRPGPAPPPVVPEQRQSKAVRPVPTPSTLPPASVHIVNPSGGDIRTRIQSAVTDLVLAAERSGQPIGLMELGEALVIEFPTIYEKIARAAGYPNLTQMLQDNRSVRIEGKPPKQVVRSFAR